MKFLLKFCTPCLLTLVTLSLSYTKLSAQIDKRTPQEILIDSLENQILKLKNYNSNEKVYGHALFKSDSIKIFDQSSINKIPERYIVGIGDEITVVIFGQSQYDAKSIVDKNGQVSFDKIPKILVQGLQWGQVTELIKKRFFRYAVFNENQIAITLTNPRTITVNVFGNVNKPGTYSLPATNTAFNAIIAAGGPQSNASLRNIKVKNNNKTTDLDIYQLMNDPSLDFRYYMDDNAVIQVPLANKIVHTKGAFTRAIDYELKDYEGLQSLMEFSGGLLPNANKDLVQIKRFTDNELILVDAEIKKIKSKDILLMPGDTVIANIINGRIVNQIFIEGAVEVEGNFSLTSTPRISDLIKKARLKREAKTDKAFLYRQNQDNTYDIIEIDLKSILSQVNSPANLQLTSNDRLLIQSASDEITKSTVLVSGEVRKPVTLPFDPDSTLTIAKALELAGGLDDQASDIGYLVRQSLSNSNKKSYIRINLVESINTPNGKSNIRLQPDDQILAYKNSEISDQLYVSTKGAFRNNVELYYDPNLSIENIIELSSGFTQDASRRIDVYRLELLGDVPSRVVVASLSVDENNKVIIGDTNFEIKPNDEFVARVAADIDKHAFVKIQGEVNYPGPYALTKKNENLKSIIEKAGGLTNEAFIDGIKLYRSNGDSLLTPIVIRDEELTNEKFNILLKSRDSIVIPKLNDVIRIQLTQTKIYELNPSKYPTKIMGVHYQRGKKANWYIDNYAGGFGSKANKSVVIVEYPNGKVKKTKKFLFLKKYPEVKKGSMIYIEEKRVKPIMSSEKSNGFKIPKTVQGVVIYENGIIENKAKEYDNEEKKVLKENTSENDIKKP